MTYEYACTACGHAWEAEQSISAAALTECPECKQATAKRQVSGGAGFILKGGGWYADLYSSAKKSPEPSGDSASSDSKSKTVDKPKTDTAAATTTSTTPSAPSGSSSSGPSSPKAASS